MIGLNRPLDTTNGVKLLGERNSGTNVLEHLLRQVPDLHLFPSLPMLTWRNTLGLHRPVSALWRYRAAQEETLDYWHKRALPHSGGWKHAAPTSDFHDQFLATQQPAVLVIIRHPAAWLRSMHRNPFHALTRVPTEFSAFIRHPWLCTERDGLSDRRLPDLPALYSKKLDGIARMLRTYSNSALIRFEDLQSAPVETLSVLGLPCPPSFELPETDLRAFAKDTLRKAETNRTVAANAGYDALSGPDAGFLKSALDGSPAMDLYPA
ncbi:hypothetical protein BXY66_0574 [Shimia isoporae]|uniref:Sulfotransferase family protein n=1 Tax=Shimia isoporae TaxID=647720 RepID=A0A4R1NJS9_9RHOB|nr:hypothetical protein [Shimia isoporae]TCL08537.1 hypothetical protein BXY66_0574 [Shimia isoporae]